MADRKDAQEPSMEEILTSIRKIIADEQDEPARPAGEPARAATPTASNRPTAAVETEEDELVLTDLVSEPPAKPAPPPPSAAAAAHPSQPPERPSMSVADDTSLVSPATAQASAAALARLTRAVAPEERSVPTSGRSVEELVIELLRPQLKEWLDQNLAPLVERVVEQEIKKLARRAELL
jgi:cell pole-organizing protein PopZ